MTGFFDRIRRFFKKPEQREDRLFYINDADSNEESRFSSNKIATTKYTWYTFIPRGLFEQFRRVANFYFLFNAIISLTPLSPVMPITTITPLVFVIGLAMLKELWEDIKRGASDYETNKRKIRVILPDGSEAMREWRELRVGDIVQVEGDTYFPADLICLASSSDDGSCYVETMNLDGETNLKLRQALHETYSLDGSQLARLRGTVECEHPNVSIYTFTGKMRLEGLQETPIFLSPTNILLRGSKLRNTRFAVGLVVYSGRETKIMMNATDPPSKRSFVERRLDYVILFELVLMLSLAIFPAAVFAARLPYQEQYMWYLELDQNAQLTGLNKAQYNADNPALAGVLQFFTCLVLYGMAIAAPCCPPSSSFPPSPSFHLSPPFSFIPLSPPLSSPLLSSPPFSSPPISSPPTHPLPPPLSSPRLIPTPLIPTPLIPTPLIPTPLIPTPLIPTPLIPTPLIPTPLIPTPLIPTPLIPTPLIPTPVIPSPAGYVMPFAQHMMLDMVKWPQPTTTTLCIDSEAAAGCHCPCYFVPISLYVTMEIVKLLQAVTISLDLHMYYEDKDIPAIARTSNINEELGMVRTVLSDKTGTLTRNQMEFFKCSIAGTPYGMGVTEVEKAAAQRAGRPPPEEDEDDDQVYVPERPLEKGFNMRDPRLDGMKWVEQPCADEIRRFLEVLSVCHTVVVDTAPIERAASSNIFAMGSAAGVGSGGVLGSGAGGMKSSSSSSSVSVASAGSSVRGGAASASAGGGGTLLLPGEGGGGGETPLMPGGEEAVDGEAVRFLAESPDEAAFVVAAKRLGFLFLGRQGNELKVREYGARWSVVQDRSYELLNTLEFTSHRKRMSVVVRTPEGRLLLLCKGADSVIMDRLSASEHAQKYRPITERHMTMYAEAGLRTLAIAWREVGEEEYAAWQQRWVEAKGYVADAGVQAERLEALADELESGLVLVGATAIEDKLQVGVPQAIETLAQAGIKLWVLTGDKLETAINIGFACSLLRHHMQQHLVFLEDNDAAAKEAARRGVPLKEFAAELVRSQILAASESVHGAQSMRWVIDGKALVLVLADDALRAAFLELALQCASVICCRVSPKQKAQVTAMVRREGKQICLAIGDGANDVGMIQKANIGVGIRGEEGQQVGGMVCWLTVDSGHIHRPFIAPHVRCAAHLVRVSRGQAVMASDFAIGQFRFLERLLLVHGGWCYKRICILITYFFYKCFVFAFTILFYNCLAYFSGTAVYYDWYLTLFMVFFTSLPIGVVGVMDQDVKAVYRLRYPQLYKQVGGHRGQRNEYFSGAERGELDGERAGAGRHHLQRSRCCPSPSVPDRSSGLILDLTAIVLERTAFHHIFGSILFFFVLMTVGSSYLPAKWVGNLVGVAAQLLLPAASFWLNLLLAVVAAMLPSYAIRGMWRHVCPGDHEVVQEIERRERRRRLMRLSTMARHMCAGAPLVTNHGASGAADVERSAHGSAGSDDSGEGKGKGKKKGVGGVGNGVVGEYQVAAEQGPSVAEELRHRHSSSRDTQQ
ncbi:unnamed protein product [Closterium sp. NIES-64]|nr:unnamed protein product [Closterium sp. NIES-64]